MLLSRQVRKRFKTLDIGTNVEGFKIRINQYLDKLKTLREKQNEHLRLMQKLYLKKAYVELGVEQLKKNIHEIEKISNMHWNLMMLLFVLHVVHIIK